MLTIKTFLKEAGRKGIGLFTSEKLNKGQTFWVLNELFEIRITREKYNSLPELQRKFVDEYGYFEPDGLCTLILDNSRFMNHSDDPNTTTIFKNGVGVSCEAVRDVESGEEITIDYRHFATECMIDLGFENLE